MLIKENIIDVIKRSFGNIIEWYDYSLYGYFAVIISNAFFPSDNHWLSLLLTFGAFAAGYIARPFGSIFFGYLGDKKGRHFAMNIAILFMAIPTIVMSLIPSYDQVGIVAPIILVIVRLFQGISAGGQFGNLMVISSENNPIRCAGLNVSIAFSTSIFGFVMASGVSYLSVHLFASHLNSLVWRFPFSFGAVLLIIFLLLREKDQKKVSLANHRSPLLYLLNQYKKHLITSTILATVTLMIYYVDITYLTTYLVKVLGFSLSESLAMNTVAIFFMFLVTPLFGLISDKIGRKKLLVMGFLISTIMLPILFYALSALSYILSSLVLIMLAIFTGMLQGAANPCYTEIFPKQVRASGASIVYGFGASLSGFSPLLCTILSGFLPATLSIALLTFVLCFIGLLVSLYLPDKQMEVRRLNDFAYMAYKKKQAKVFKKVSTNVSVIN